MASILTKVGSFFKTKPVLTNVVVYSSLYAAGDFTRQSLMGAKKIDKESVGRFALVGGGCFGPLYHFWYKWMDGRIIGNTGKIVVKKIILDQTIAGVAGLTIFFTAMSILEGKKDIFEDLKTRAPRAYVTGWLYWPLMQGINFFFLPTHLRAPYVAVCAFAWTTALSYIKNMEIQETQKLEQ